MFDPTHLRTFLAVARTLSFTQAAAQLGISQPSVSQHVRRLEEAAGRQLLVRDTRAVSLTDNGEAMAGFARSILAAHDEAASYFTGTAMRGRLRFGAADDLAIAQLPGVLRTFRQRHPQINLELTVTQTAALQRRLAANQLDLVFVKEPPGETSGRVVRRDRLVWIGLPGTRLPDDAPLPLITYAAPSLSKTTAVRALAEAGRTWRITCKTLEVNGVLAAVRAGIGIAVYPASLVPDDVQVLPGTLGLPELGDIDITLVANPRSPKEPIEALTAAILRQPFPSTTAAPSDDDVAAP
ncbi:transcriptional regulator, LysR family [Beutenbergia cavernae DSM 12333]|uniref:Transcriptional regulator, LysR family n=1 Tax=Beutenbergia cavernae (strain ATCC BAA-8 / DSM 12333 / CCUG 43141 / JCM 11478 / NBRC 16432 / NCIMB 13614 / HKI 0122) TaxID=471853 RepID=C5BWR0_BEUC1|nr:LysR substrate-binding domain-containing protein [Beutenbergia cavernae]ACQ80726.1 transcriptional regulator, LysR family [Beutenbergia cavernae DSM 12333]